MPVLVPRRFVAAALVPVVLAGHTLLPVAGAAAPPAADRRLALLVVPAPEIAHGAAATLREAATAALAARGVTVVAGAAPPPPDAATVDALRTALTAGRAAYEALDPTAAHERLAAVTGALEADPRLLAAAPELLDAPLYLGLVAFGLGDRDGARDAFRRAIRLAPERALPAGRFSPAVEEAYALARIQLAALRPALLRIDSTPEGADLFVDGVHRGRTPLAVDALERGRHLVVALAPSGGVSAHAVDATEYGPDILHLLLPAGAAAPRVVALARQLVEESPPASLGSASARNLADALGADRLALVSVSGALAGFAATAGLVDLRTGVWLGHGPVGEAGEAALLGERLAAWTMAPPTPLATAAGAAVSALVPDWRAAPGGREGVPDGRQEPDPRALLSGPGDEDAGRRPDTRWYHRWYWWAAIGAGVAASSGGGGGGGGTGSVSVAP